ncbi:FecR domain-containing protein [Siphonobacter sp. SORGH_AS_0500]|uniref:FecR family protein n=1 Tax=Siphonobacter sp. SORGH_AS_0500 TaxID=1864824 RepID=UPI0028657150|nr:FecR domain-containing protein [Siphonobacter sp. SORGH_AS_0500]MDR6197323.1 transmembrane sensor [Siphonobacter sp. SORGH_AS_0500]
MEHPVTKRMVFEHFAGRLSPLQRRLMEEWLESPQHQEIYYTWLEEWEHQNLQYVADSEEALRKSLTQLGEMPDQRPEEVKPSRTWLTFRRLSVAALLLLSLSACFYAGFDRIFYKTFETGYGQVKQITLSDGTLVTLNAHSSLQVPRFTFLANSRRAFLKGEADFDVKHLPDHQPFRITTERNFQVTVLGTKFTVFARSRKTQLVLKTGKVQIDYTKDHRSEKLLMKPGELVSLDQKGRLQRKQVPSPTPYDAWKDHRYEFNHTSLEELSYMLEENYGLEVDIKNPPLRKETTSGSYQARNADELLQLISQLFEINYNRQNNHVTFSQ